MRGEKLTRPKKSIPENHPLPVVLSAVIQHWYGPDDAQLRRGNESEEGRLFRPINRHCHRACAAARIIRPVAAEAHVDVVGLRLELVTAGPGELQAVPSLTETQRRRTYDR